MPGTGDPVEIDAATQEQVDAFVAWIESADMEFQWDMEIYALIFEDLQPFFKGEKTVEETVEIIQSRMQIYVNENR